VRWSARDLAAVPLVPSPEADDFDWRPLQHFFGLTAFGANVFAATRDDQILVEAHDERESGQEELYLVLEGEAEFEVEGETFAAARGTAVAVTDPAVVRRVLARTRGTSLLAVGARPGCFETTWRGSNLAEVPRADGAAHSE
jgi:mannose-6-phosphate isomerase-like protein (cupin superfamily)